MEYAGPSLAAEATRAVATRKDRRSAHGRKRQRYGFVLIICSTRREFRCVFQLQILGEWQLFVPFFQKNSASRFTHLSPDAAPVPLVRQQSVVVRISSGNAQAAGNTRSATFTGLRYYAVGAFVHNPKSKPKKKKFTTLVQRAMNRLEEALEDFKKDPKSSGLHADYTKEFVVHFWRRF